MNSPARGATALVEALKAQGVSTVFGIPGAHTMPIYDALHHDDAIRHITVRHEQGAGFMAEGYARRSGTPGVALLTSGPAVTNASTALASAYADSIPVLVIASSLPRSRENRPGGELHEMKNQLAVMQAVAGWTRRVRYADEIGLAIADCFTYLRSERPRGAYLEVPLDLFDEPVRLPVPGRVQGLRTGVDPDDVRLVAQRLRMARRPLVVAGAGMLGAEDALQSLIETVGAPVLLGPKGKGLIDDRHPLVISSRYLRILPELEDLVRTSDLVLVLGSRLGAERTGKHSLPLPASLVHIDIDPSELGRNYPAGLGIVADAQEFIRQLLLALASAPPEPGSRLDGSANPGSGERRQRQAAVQRVREENQAWTRAAYGEQTAFLDAIGAELRDCDTVVADMTVLGYASPELMSIARPRRYIHSYEFCAIGAGFPTALGARVASGGEDVIALCGDGGVLLTITELATAVQSGIGVIAIIFNDNAYTAVRREQQRFYPGRLPATALNAPDFVALAHSFGAQGVLARTPDELRAAIAAARGRDLPTVIEVPLPAEYAVTLWAPAWGEA
ncbi:MAG: thiamine pyrophosphate-binding protein [Beutenbergiaceae bacterium]